MIVFTFTRPTSNTTQALSLGISIGGTAARDIDYQLVGLINFSVNPPAVTIPAGSSTTQIVARPISDFIVELNESIILGIVSSNGSQVSAPVLVTATIIDDDAALNLITGTSIGDNLVGTSAADRIIGGGGDDALEGGAGNDQIQASGLNDAYGGYTNLVGDGGNDLLIGGSFNPNQLGGFDLAYNLLDGSNSILAGVGEHDILVGGFTSDANCINYYYLGNDQVCYYVTGSDSDYATITNLKPESDVISLSGTASNYATTYNAHITHLFYNNNGVYDLIAKIDSDVRLMPEDGCFSYVTV
jgi:RTX calcium-binding nonapeptide repeat (4 copies)